MINSIGTETNVCLEEGIKTKFVYAAEGGGVLRFGENFEFNSGEGCIKSMQ